MTHQSEATLHLPKESYAAWLKARYPFDKVGVRPSSAGNPLNMYLMETLEVGVMLHTDGKRAWFMLRLDRNHRSILQVFLPDWVVPLVVNYTEHRTATYTTNPGPIDIDARQALEDLEYLAQD